MKPFVRKDILIIAVAVALCAVAALLFAPKAGHAKAVRIYLDDELYCERPMGEDEVLIEQNGQSNLVHITENGVYMERSTCENQNCVHQGEVNDSSGELGCWIICLPNRVSVELVMEEEG